MTLEKPSTQKLNADTLVTRTRKDLATMARRFEVSGWHAMRKDELIEALLAVPPHPSKSTSQTNGKSTNGKSTNGRPANGSSAANGKTANGKTNGTHHSNPHASNRHATVRLTATDIMRRRLKSTVDDEIADDSQQDQLTASVIDAYWIHVRWCLSPAIIERAEAALGLDWHQAIPVIRVFDVTTDDLATSGKTWIRDIEIHGNVDHWFVPVENPPGAYRLHIGYRTPTGNFFALARSNRVATQISGAVGTNVSSNNNGQHSQENGRNMFAPQKQSNRRIATIPRLKNAINGCTATSDFQFELDAELLIVGSTHPDAELTLMGEPVRLNDDGSFSLRMKLPDGRQIIPIVVITPNGNEQRTTVLGIERNTKKLDTLNLDEMLM